MTVEKAKVIRFGEEAAYTPDGIVSKQILKTKGGNITLFSFDQGQSLSEHTAPFDALIQVLDGSALVSIDGKEYHVATSESIILPANIPHAVKAESAFKMLLTMLREV